MVATTDTTKTRLVSYLRSVAPFSIVDRGLEAADNNAVTDCSFSGNIITGGVKEDDGNTQSLQLVILSDHDVEATCSCCSKEEMAEQWCVHAVALLWHSSRLDFFKPLGGFGERESTFRITPPNASDVAEAFNNVLVESENRHAWSGSAPFTPKVSIFVDTSSDRLGIRLLFDEEAQEPTLFESFRRTSGRALDNVLVGLLEDEGTFDDHRKLWFVNSSRGIELVLGLIQEYDSVFLLKNSEPLSFSHDLLDAILILTWREASLELSMRWRTEDSAPAQAPTLSGQIVGTGPFWVVNGRTLFRLSPLAARIVSLLGTKAHSVLPRSQTAPLLDVLQRMPSAASAIEIVHPELQPVTEIRSPTPILSIERRDVATDHFTSSRQLELSSMIEFDYPIPPVGSNVVYLPHREAEARYLQSLEELGFSTTTTPRRLTLSGDLALDFIAGAHEQLAAPWKLAGLDGIKQSIRFAELGVTVAVTSGEEARETKSKTDQDSIEALTGIDWFECHVALTQNRSNVPLSSLFKNARSDSDRWIRLDSGAFARVPGGTFGNLRTILGMVEADCRLSNTIRAKLSLPQAVGLSRLGDNGFSVTVDKRLRMLADQLSSFNQIAPQKPTKGFKGKLRSYQEEGLSWLHFLHEFQLGGILADEMGLGKTVQTLAFFQSLVDNAKPKTKPKPVLIIAPTSVITNWAHEIKKFAPGLTALLLHGPQRKALFSEIPNNHLILTSYALLRVDRYDLERYEFSYLVLDEAQNIKNPQAATTKAAKALRSQHRLALTGTPTENRPLELWSIMDFLMPNYLGSYEFFKNQVERPILEGGPGVQVADLLRSKTRPFILRRLKSQVEKDLPPKMESTLYVDMTQAQKELYSQILAEVRPKVQEAVKKRGIRGASVSILSALLRLRQVCNHPNSIDALSDVPGYDSGKFNLLKDLVTEAIESGRKILLFSQFRGMLSIIQAWLHETQVEHLYLDGATKNRQDLIDQFSTDESIRLFLISLKAGGTGLNLMAADTVIIYDPWWNPAVENQAVDRAHRIGQQKAVTVYRLVTEDSVEQKIMDLKSKKAKLVDALINENGLSTIDLTKTDLEKLFGPLQ